MIVPVPVPDVGLRLSQVTVSLAVHVRVPPPVLLIVTDWLTVVLLFCCAVSETLRGLAPMAGGIALTVRVTGMVCGVLEAPVAVSMTDAV